MDWDPISLTFSGKFSIELSSVDADHTLATDPTKVSFKNSQVGDAGKSFKFTDVSTLTCIDQSLLTQ